MRKWEKYAICIIGLGDGRPCYFLLNVQFLATTCYGNLETALVSLVAIESEVILSSVVGQLLAIKNVTL